ncbi:large conductance mechanosensitive channel protein MscL [Pseudanabaena biceps]|nr:large conductance mechanosensitive channel protein MscL [Pseudanabaena biceps]
MDFRNTKRSTRSFLKDFNTFITRGNVVDLAVAVVIGGAFGKIVTSLIEDILTPLILNPALNAARVDDLAKLQINGIKYGVFLASVINFVVIALSIFLVIRAFSAIKRKEVREEDLKVEEVKPDPQERLTLAIERLSEIMEAQK